MRKVLCILLVASTLLAGCMAQNQPSDQSIHGTLDNIFTEFPTSPTDTSAPTVPDDIGLGTLGFGFDIEWDRDAKGRYIAYEGGQLHIPFHVSASGMISTYDVGILLFIDGVAQPYRVEPDGEYAYMHTFSHKDVVQSPEDIIMIYDDIYFTPMTGEEGDMLEFYAMCMLNPEYLPSQGLEAFAHTSGAILLETRLHYHSTPQEESYPEKSTRLLNVSTSMVDCTAKDVEFWTDLDLITNQRTAFTVNESKTYVYGVQEHEPIRLRFEVWGSPYVHYGLIFFVDNVPVYTADLADIWVTVEMGKKTIIEATLDMTGFSGESVVYAMLVARNHYSSEIETLAYFRESSTIYLLAKEKDA